MITRLIITILLTVTALSFCKMNDISLNVMVTLNFTKEKKTKASPESQQTSKMKNYYLEQSISYYYKSLHFRYFRGHKMQLMSERHIWSYFLQTDATSGLLMGLMRGSQEIAILQTYFKLRNQTTTFYWAFKEKMDQDNSSVR